MGRPESSTIGSLLEELAAAYPDQTVAIDLERSVTYEDLKARADALASGLRGRGVSSDDRLAILMENRVEWVETMFAAHRIGATVVGISTWATPQDLEYYLNHSGADVLVATASFAGTDFAAVLDELLNNTLSKPDPLDAPAVPNLETVVLLGADRPGATSFADLPAESFSFDNSNNPEDVALLLYTSGSTSKPKAVPLLHGGIIENGYHIGERMHLSPVDRVWLASPLFWSYGSANALSALITHGGSLVLQAPFDPSVAVDLLKAHDCTVYYGMPNMAKQLVEVDGFDRDRLSLRTGTTIGSPDEVEFTMDELGISELCNVYGATETYGNCAVTDSGLPRKTRLHTQGKPLPGQDIVITDPETGERLPQSEIGEIRVGGRITPGYHNNPEKNQEAFDNDGYLRMGDLGCLDSEGHVQFHGRLKNVLKIGGINVSPIEVEDHLLEHPAIDQAFIVGLKHPEKGEVIGAIIVPESGIRLTEALVYDHCKSLAAYKRPSEVIVTSSGELPQTDTGKIQRDALSELFE